LKSLDLMYKTFDVQKNRGFSVGGVRQHDMRLAVCVVGVMLPWATGFAPSWLSRRSGSVPGDRVRLFAVGQSDE